MRIVALLLIVLALLIAVSGFLGLDLVNQFRNLAKGSLGTNHGKVITRFAVLSDTHSDNENTKLALEEAKDLGVDYLIHVGDWTTVGTVKELNEQKDLFQNNSLPYWGIMGDHDRWQSAAKNFEVVFGKTYESFDRNGIHHILLDDSDIIGNALGKDQLSWLENDLKETGDKPIVIFMHLPIYHPTSDRTLALKAGNSSERAKEAERFLNLVKGKKVLGIFSGDHHYSASYTEPKTGVKIWIVGAVTRDRNLQKPRFTIVEIYEDYFIKATDQII